MGLDPAGGPGASPGHVVPVVSVMMVMMMMVVIQVWRLTRAASIRPLLLLEVSQPLIVTLQLIPEQRVLLGAALLVVLQTPDPVQAVQVDPSSPPDAHSVHDQMRSQVHLAGFLVKVAVPRVNGVVPGCAAKNELEVGAGRRESNLRVALPTAILKAYLTFFHRPVSVPGVSHLALATESSEQFVALELPFLIGDHSGHLEDEPRPGLLVEPHPVEGQNTDAESTSSSGVFAHSVHHLAPWSVSLAIPPTDPRIRPMNKTRSKRDSRERSQPGTSSDHTGEPGTIDSPGPFLTHANR